MNIKILVATHKIYWIPNDPIYVPIHVGKEGKSDLGFLGDNTGTNISNKNADYCELTGLYWAWKNLEADYIGSVHYRRYFVNKNRGLFSTGQKSDILASEDFKKILVGTDIILPNKRHYYIETVKKQYIHAHDSQPYYILEEIICEKYPKYHSAFKNMEKRRWAHIFNMFVMKKSLFDSYCEWLFDILFELENRLFSHEPRLFGFLSERLLDVWIETNQLNYYELPVAFMEKQNWLKKGSRFISRKIKG